MNPARQRTSLVVLALCVTLPTMSDAQPSMDQRILELEARLQVLSERIDLLEQRPATDGPSTPPSAQLGADSTSADASGVVWTLGTRLADGPWRITHKAFDRGRGRVDLLLQITAPLQDPEHWAKVGGEVPMLLRMRGAYGIEHVQALTLARGNRLEPGAYIHLQADIDPARSAAVGQFIIELADASPARSSQSGGPDISNNSDQPKRGLQS